MSMYDEAQFMSEKKQEHLWIADSGATCHITNDSRGYVSTREDVNKMQFANEGNEITTKVIGEWTGRSYKMKKGLNKLEAGSKVHMNGTILMPELRCNLFSLTKAMEEGAVIRGSKNGINVSWGNTVLTFDYKIRSKLGCVWGAMVKHIGIHKEKGFNNEIKRDINVFHQECGHTGKTKTMATAKRLGYKLTGKWIECESCAKGKAKKKNIKKTTDKKAERPGERMALDITSCRNESYGGKKFAHVKIDFFTNMLFCEFLKTKSEVVEDGLNFVTMVSSKLNRLPENIRLDNS
jgi:hypothetical protein